MSVHDFKKIAQLIWLKPTGMDLPAA